MRGDALVAGVSITHAERVVYVEDGIRKLDIATYHAAVAPLMLRYVAKRPVSIVRCPAGPGTSCFFQKHAGSRAIPGIELYTIEESKGPQPYLVANAAAALVGIAQMGGLELHTWGATIDDIEKPDTLVLDLDPAPDLPWDRVVAGAYAVRARLAACGLVSFVKTTGGKGLHVVAPLSRRSTWDEQKSFARAIAERLAMEEPAAYTTTIAKAARSGRIFIDYLRNARGATAVAPYSLRARAHAPIAMPLAWHELDAGAQPSDFTLQKLAPTIAHRTDAWQDFRSVRQSITASSRRAAGAASGASRRVFTRGKTST